MEPDPVILIVDGSPLIRTAATRMIHKAFPASHVVGADGHEAALELVRRHRPQVVITDIHLREGDGFALSESIAARYPHILVVVFTDQDAPEYRTEALRRGADYFVSKTEADGRVLLRIIAEHPGVGPAD